MFTTQTTTCPITNTEVPLFNFDNLRIESLSNDNFDTGRQLCKEKQHQICLNLISMLGLSQGISEEKISNILSTNLKTFDSFENAIGVVLNKIIKYTSSNVQQVNKIKEDVIASNKKKSLSPNKADQLNQSPSAGGVVPLAHESDNEFYDMEIPDGDFNVISKEVHDGKNNSTSQDNVIDSKFDKEDNVELDESFLIEKKHDPVNAGCNREEERSFWICNAAGITKPEYLDGSNAESLLITNVNLNSQSDGIDSLPRFKIFSGHLQAAEFKNHVRSLGLPSLPEIRDINIRKIAKGREKYRGHWKRYEYLGNYVLKLSTLRIVLEYFMKPLNHSLESIIDFLNSRILFVAYCICLNLHEDNNIPQDAHYKIYADAYIAFFGGLYLDQGEEVVTEYLTELMTPLLCNLTDYQHNDIESQPLNIQTMRQLAARYFNLEWLIWII
ncbi:855_t:CDS:2 [Funneliformis geosporum]|uniref:16128_t:CDS:1 n=1 Tax=Funneliformis geosporum TaxID=1117311 RepID=A0A9W4WUL1_9GLOM|nr:855_t:CDS:2 [Funneliformis geosporum]CAI2173278.1 16128_t:CDS:2 [Funneliformis geosporum]